MACISSKSVGTIIVAKQVLAAGAQHIPAVDLNVDTFVQAFYAIHFGREVAADITNPVNFRLEGSTSLSGGGYWFPLTDMYKGTVANHASATGVSETEAVTGTVNAGQKVITLASTTNLALGDIVLVRNTVVANSEWGRIAALVVNTSITLEDNLLFAQTGSTVLDAAEFFAGNLDVQAFRRIRVVCDAKSAAQATFIEVIVNLVK